MLRSWCEFLKARWAEPSRLQLTQNLAFVDNGQAAIHAMMELDAAAGQVETNR